MIMIAETEKTKKIECDVLVVGAGPAGTKYQNSNVQNQKKHLKAINQFRFKL